MLDMTMKFALKLSHLAQMKNGVEVQQLWCNSDFYHFDLSGVMTHRIIYDIEACPCAGEERCGGSAALVQ